MALIPPGNYPLNELIDQVIELKYGKDATAKATIQDSPKGMNVIRAGKKTSYKADTKKADDAREVIRKAILDGRLKVYASSEGGDEMYITKDEWRFDRKKLKYEGFQCEDTLFSGRLVWRAKPAYDGQPVYIRDKEAQKLIGTLVGEGATELHERSASFQKKTNRGRPPFPYSEKFANEVIKLHSRNITIKDIPYRATITKILNPDASNQGKVIDKETYKIKYKHAYSTVYKYTVKAIEEHKKKKPQV